MSEIRYLLDENTDPLFRAELLKREPELVVWRVDDPGAPASGTADPVILEWCEENGFILVTNNRRSMPRHLQDHLALGRHSPGILELNPNMGVGETIDELVLIWNVSSPDEYQDLLLYLPLT